MSPSRNLAKRSLDRFNRRLVERRDAALEVAERFNQEALDNQTTADHSDLLDPTSTAGTPSEESYALAARAREQVLAAEAALERIADGSFGICAACGTDIPFERLQALPTTLWCLGCAGRRGPGASVQERRAS